MVVGALHENFLQHLLIRAETKVGHRKLVSVGLDLGLRGLLSHYLLFGDEWLRLGDDLPARILNLRIDVLIAVLVLSLFFTLVWDVSFH